MSPFQATLLDYMIIWFGIVGGRVGLDIPLSMVMPCAV